MDISTSNKSSSLESGSPGENTKTAAMSKDAHQVPSNTIQRYLQKAFSSSVNTGEIPASLFSPVFSFDHTLISPNNQSSWPFLKTQARNNILLYAGSFNPPHQGHLATILYFSKLREEFGITSMFVFADPVSIVDSRKKKWGDIILPQELRYELFYRVPEISQLVASGWLQLLVGDMNNHINVLRMTTDLIAEAGFDVKLVGLLGGDKLTVESAPHLHPGNLEEWGPVDEFLIINARRPVDFFDPTIDKAPKNLPGCTEWVKDMEDGDVVVGRLNKGAGVLWSCQALTVTRKPNIYFRASQSSASNGVSSTKIRQIMTEAPDGELRRELKDKVISVEFLVEWLQLQRSLEREDNDEKAFL